ncbi:DEAD/DEAH box helicase [Aquabacterium sp.]|uniref:DEAD/DEAH box helicase n=1 Tax=Aquabacterium sp. TaxID=1872578 RepID=UPI0035B49704
MSQEAGFTLHFRPRLTLQTLNRGDGLLGMRGEGAFGPRGGEVSVARVDWTYVGDHGLFWSVVAPQSILSARAPAPIVLQDAQGASHPLPRDWEAEAEALSQLRDTGLQPLPADLLQWRSPMLAADLLGDQPVLWSLTQEDAFADLWAEQVPVLQRLGWHVAVRRGFAHQSVPVTAWHIEAHPAQVSPSDGDDVSRAIADWLPLPVAAVQPLGAPRRQGSWLLTLGVEVDGQRLDLAPMIADLLKRDRRWLDAWAIREIDDEALIRLRAPGGKRIDAPAAPLKAIVGTMIDLLSDPRRAPDEAIELHGWDTLRIEALRDRLRSTQAERAGVAGAWQLRGDTGLSDLVSRLRASPALDAMPQPAGLQVTLRPYQLQGLAWLQYLRAHQLGGILADDMGLGKTAQALAHLLVEQQAGRLDRPALIVMPTSLVFNWVAECRRMAPSLRLLVLQGPARHRRFAEMPQADVVLTTYPLLWRDIDALAAHPFHMLILDEAQMVKNATSRGATAVRRLQARYRLCLTGTPLENHLGELWAQFDFLMPGFLGDWRAFQRTWREPIEKRGETVRAACLAQRVRPFILRRRKADVATELPPKTEAIQLLGLEGRQKALYESVRVAADKQVRRVLQTTGLRGGMITVLDALLRLRQVCCDPWLVKDVALHPQIERAKLAWLRENLPALVADGRRILIFSQFTEMLKLVGEDMAQWPLPFLQLTGDTPPAGRADVVERFQSAEQEAVLLISLKAGGVGLNLTAADTVIHLDPWWNPAIALQATDRAHRLGQSQPVTVYQLVVEGSIEQRILALQERKQGLAEGILGVDADGAALAKFSEEDLAGLLAPLA